MICFLVSGTNCNFPLTLALDQTQQVRRWALPEERAAHAACCLNYGQQHSQLLITGGRSKEDHLLGDAWVLDVDNGRWRKVRLNVHALD